MVHFLKFEILLRVLFVLGWAGDGVEVERQVQVMVEIIQEIRRHVSVPGDSDTVVSAAEVVH